MKEFVRLNIFLVCILLLGCETESRTSICDRNGADLQGCWTTERCLQWPQNEEITSDTVWFKGQYNFLSNGRITFTRSKYSDDQCLSIQEKTLVFDEDSEEQSLTYEETSETKVIEELNASSISLHYVFDTDPVELGEQVMDFSEGDIDGFFVIQENRLCFSTVWLGPIGIGLTSPNIGIDFDSCLIRTNEH